jgi:hypothetical protein
VVIAVADSGLRLDHEEFQGAIWSNVDDPPDGIDNDANGFIDDGIGWDFINGDNNPAHSSNHGTHVAGIAVARMNNRAGIAGMCQCTIMPLQVFNGANGTWEAIAEAISYAVDNDATLINYSGGGFGGAGVLQTAVEYAWDNNVTIVAAAGNNGSTTPYYPGAYPETIAVSATGEDDVYYTSSNRGPWVDVCAPGIGVYSSIATGPSSYGFDTGTSFATPHVSGLVGLMLSLNPDLHIEEIRQMLHENTVDLGDPGFDIQFGHGRIDARAVLDAVLLTTQPMFTFPQGLPTHVEPGAPTTMQATIFGGANGIDPDSPTLVYRFGDGEFFDAPMTPLGDDEYEVVLPATDCDNPPAFYFTVTAMDNTIVTSPASAPNELYSATVGAYVTLFEDTFESDGGWESTFVGGATTGQWVREDPIGTTAQPEDDFTPDGVACFVTGNCEGQAGTCDVDGGPVMLTSPLFDLDGAEGVVQYARWFYNNNDNDTLLVEISNDDGDNWTLLETVGPGGLGGWEVVAFNVSEFVTPTSEMRVRFTTADVNTVSLTEAAIDDFLVEVFECQNPDTIAPEIMHDGGVMTRPHSGYIDPRQESTDGVALDQGVTEITITFTEPVRDIGADGDSISTDAFSILTDAPESPTITDLTTTDNTTVNITLSGPLPLSHWTTIVAEVEDFAANGILSQGDLGPGVNEPDRVDIGFLPGDIDQSGQTQALDLLRLRQIFFNQFHNPEGEDIDYVDLDRNGKFQPADLLRFRQLFYGTGPATQVWNGATLTQRP